MSSKRRVRRVNCAGCQRWLDRARTSLLYGERVCQTCKRLAKLGRELADRLGIPIAVRAAIGSRLDVTGAR